MSQFHSFCTKKKITSVRIILASVRPTRNAHFIHKTILVHEKIAQIHTNTQRKVIVTSRTLVKWY